MKIEYELVVVYECIKCWRITPVLTFWLPEMMSGARYQPMPPNCYAGHHAEAPAMRPLGSHIVHRAADEPA